MTIIGYVSDDEFKADFRLDFGKGIRGEYVAHRKKVAGVVVCHRLAGDVGCACSVFWVKVNDQKVFTKSQDDPLTIEESIRCDCGMHGWIRNGEWQHAHDSLL